MSLSHLLNNINLLLETKKMLSSNNPTKKNITYEIYDTNINTEYNMLMTKHSKKLLNMLSACFNTNVLNIYQNYGIWIIATIDNIAVAALLIINDFIWNVCRDPQNKHIHGYGIGEKLLKYTINYFYKKYYPNYKNIYLYASSKPTPRQKFYESVGFVITGEYNNDDPKMAFALDNNFNYFVV